MCFFNTIELWNYMTINLNWKWQNQAHKWENSFLFTVIADVFVRLFIGDDDEHDYENNIPFALLLTIKIGFVDLCVQCKKNRQSIDWLMVSFLTKPVGYNTLVEEHIYALYSVCTVYFIWESENSVNLPLKSSHQKSNEQRTSKMVRVPWSAQWLSNWNLFYIRFIWANKLIMVHGAFITVWIVTANNECWIGRDNNFDECEETWRF